MNEELSSVEVVILSLRLQCDCHFTIFGTLSLIAGPEGVAGLVALLSEVT